MKRLLTNAVIFASGLMASSQLLALGLGELKLESALSQPLKAEIELVDTKGLTKWEIKPTLASQEDFERAGVDRVYFLTKIDFKVEGDRIVLTTREAINEPFLNFLVEVNWPAGRVLREYTVLLDPPTYSEENFKPLVVAPEVKETELVVATPEQPVLVDRWSEPAEAGTYKVQKNDTLWAVALETRPSSDVSPQQMMLAIQQENPEAFINGNINRLKSHHVLRIPDEQQIRSIGMTEAIAEVNRQNKALTTATAQYDATGRAGTMGGEQTSKSGGEVRLIAAQTEGADTAAAAGDVEQGGTASIAALENELAIAQEDADKSQRENEELNERLASLEEQIETLQRLISLKDDQLASMQADGVIAGATETHADAAAEQTETSESAEQDYNFAGAEVAGEDLTTELEETDEATEAEGRDLIAEQAKATEEARIRREQEAQAKLAQEQDKSILDELLANPLLPAAGAALLLLIALLVARALKKPKSEADEEALDENSEAMLNDFELSEDSLDDLGFASDDFEEQAEEAEQEVASKAPKNEAQTEDVITESDIYIAFGNFDRATEILKEAIEKEPHRADLHLKLLEVYAETDDAQAFVETESELLVIGDAEASAEAEAMRQRLTSPIEPVALDETEDTDTAASAGTEEIDMDFSSDFDGGLDFADALEMPEETAAADDLPTLDATEIEEVSEFETKQSDDDSDNLDFSVDFSSESDTPAATPEKEEVAPSVDETAESTDELETLNFDLGSNDAEVPTLDESALEEDSLEQAAEIETFEFESTPAAAKDDAEGATLDFATLDESAEEDIETLEFDVSDLQETQADETSSLDSLEDILDSDSSGDNESDLELDLDTLQFDSEEELEAPTLEEAPSEPVAEDVPVLDLESDSEELSLDSELPDFSDDELDFDLGGSSSAEEETLETLEVEKPVVEPEAPQAPTQKAAPVASGEIDLDQLAASENEFDFLAGTDECATKLDLARAYIDMEDNAGAKELLQEVIEEGTDVQISEARELLANLA